jgi:hypothetical protein
VFGHLTTRILSKEDIMQMIKEEYDSVKDSYETRINQLLIEGNDGQEKLRTQGRQIEQLTAQLKQKTVPKEDKGVQFNVKDILEMPESQDTESYFTSVNLFMVGGQLKGKDWLNPLISDILSQKAWADYQDFKAGRKLLPLREYVMEYFFKQFGCRSMSLALLKDFLVSLKTHFQDDIRVETFIELSGLSEIKHVSNMDMKNYLENQRVRLAVMTLPSTLGFYINLAFAVKNSKSSKSVYLFPNHPENNSYLITLSEAVDICMKLLKKYGFGEEVQKSVKLELTSVAAKDLYMRVAQSKPLKEKDKEEASSTHNNAEKEKLVSFDSVAEWMLKKYVDRLREKVLLLHSTITMFGANPDDSKKTFEDFSSSVGLIISIDQQV